MAEYVPQPPSTWPAVPQPPHASAVCPLEPMDLGVLEQQTPPEQPPSSPELGEDEEVTSPPDPDVPYPDLAPVVFFCLKQTTSPRNWCIKMVCNPYPFRLPLLPPFLSVPPAPSLPSPCPPGVPGR
ncbi:voltage-dependent T-type calcium channel subunit alpha-1I [Grus japonensis]|uniref:Voltage-dependent T-type calcium channel subunit alpha-1I n=1 Tax=Grus japonensis TaxID=30415 RepID=A0ABC9VVB1_GRUJA